MSKRLLIADDDVLFLRVMMLRCREIGVAVHGAADGVSALEEMRREPPDMVVLDVNMPGHDGVTVRETMLGDPVLRKIPTVFLSGRSDPAVLEQCQILRCEHVLKGPHAWQQLQPLVQRHLGAEREERAPADPSPAVADAPTGPKILIVDDDRHLVLALKLRLLHQGYRPLVAFGGQDAYHIALREMPDLIVSDYEMPGGSADYLLVRLNDGESLRRIPVIVMSGRRIDGRHPDLALEREMLSRRGAAAFLTKPLDMTLLAQTIGHLLATRADSARLQAG